MNGIATLLLVGLIVLVTHCLEGITGFGCTVLALPFIAMLLGLKTAVPVLVVLAWILAGYIIVISWRSIKWKEFAFIVFSVGLGLPIGIVLFDNAPDYVLKGILAVFMVVVGLRGFVKTRREGADAFAKGEKSRLPSSWLMRSVLFLGGIAHGAFGTGGPFVVIYASKALPNKALFRVTLCLLWFSLNSILIAKWLIVGEIFTRETLGAIAATLPFLLGGMLLGDYLHHKVNEYYFKLMVYFVLVASGLAMGYSTLTYI